MKKLKPSVVFKHKWMLPLVIACICVLPLSLVMLSFKVAGPLLAGYFIFWSAMVAGLVILVANRAAIQLAYDEKRIDEDDHRHWMVRTGIGIKSVSVVVAGLTCFFVFMMFDEKDNLVLAGDITSEVYVEVVSFLGEEWVVGSVPDKDKLPVNKIVIQGKKYFGNNIPSQVGSEGFELPVYYYNGDILDLDYATPPKKEVLSVEGEEKCVISRKVVGDVSGDNGLKLLTTNFLNETKLLAYYYKGNIVIDKSYYFSPKNNGRCGHSENKISSVERRELYDFIERYILYPNVVRNINHAEIEKRTVILSWSEFSDKFG